MKVTSGILFKNDRIITKRQKLRTRSQEDIATEEGLGPRAESKKEGSMFQKPESHFYCPADIWYGVGQLDLKPDYLRTRKLIVWGFHFISLRKIRTFPDLQHLFHSLEFLKLPGRLSSIVFISMFQVSDLVPDTGHMLDKLLLKWVNCEYVRKSLCKLTGGGM